jgi:hypothetical protein
MFAEKVALAVLALIAVIYIVDRITDRGYSLRFRGDAVELEMRPRPERAVTPTGSSTAPTSCPSDGG